MSDEVPNTEAAPQRKTIQLLNELEAPTPASTTAASPGEHGFPQAFLEELNAQPPQQPQPKSAAAQPAAAPAEPTDPLDMVAQAIEAAGGLTEQEVQELVFASRTTANVKAFLREHEHDYHQSPENDALMNRFLVENKLVPSVENLELAMETLGDMLVSPEITRYQQQPSLPPLPRPRSAQPERKPVQTGLPDSRTPAAPPDQIAELMKVVQDPSVSRDVAEDALRRAMRIKAERANRPYGSF